MRHATASVAPTDRPRSDGRRARIEEGFTRHAAWITRYFPGPYTLSDRMPTLSYSGNDNQCYRKVSMFSHTDELLLTLCGHLNRLNRDHECLAAFHVVVSITRPVHALCRAVILPAAPRHIRGYIAAQLSPPIRRSVVHSIHYSTHLLICFLQQTYAMLCRTPPDTAITRHIKTYHYTIPHVCSHVSLHDALLC